MAMIREPFEPKERDSFRFWRFPELVWNDAQTGGYGGYPSACTDPFPGRLTGKPTDC